MEEAKKEIAAGDDRGFPGVNPWDVLIWKLDSIERQIAKVDQRMDKLDNKLDTLENRMDNKLDTLENRMGNLESKSVQSYTILQWTAIVGFVAIIMSIFIAPLFR